MTIRETILKILIKNPFYGYIASKLTVKESNNIEKIKIDFSLKLIYNPVWFRSLSDNNKVGSIIHEILHIILLHPLRRGDRKRGLWAIACDIAVNQFIPKKYLDKDSIILDHLNEIIGAELSPFMESEYYYSILEEAEVPFTLSDREVSFSLESYRMLRADLIDDQDRSFVNKELFNEVVGLSLKRNGEAEGLTEELNNFINKNYREVIINWRTLIKRFLSYRGRITKRKSLRKVSRRFDNVPGKKKSQGVRALVALDESGSMSDDLVNLYIKELNEINRIAGASILVVRFDTDCSEPVPLSKYIKSTDREKRGGTDFRSVFSLADKLRIPQVIIFTDGVGDVPDSVNQRVLWVLTKEGVNPSDFGETIYFSA